ncbi:hypothetical protein COO60DRAFT_1489919 [Scenedesmus sp. NREL 46B-D3]|nr:hypothetical protein COO60DRAFT_1489919 [Scenedesmus sp. NREL 46B-D3]
MLVPLLLLPLLAKLAWPGRWCVCLGADEASGGATALLLSWVAALVTRQRDSSTSSDANALVLLLLLFPGSSMASSTVTQASCAASRWAECLAVESIDQPCFNAGQQS